MKSYDALEGIITYILKKHKYIKQAVTGVGLYNKGGVYALKMLRKPSGKRIIFEEIKNFRIIKWEAFNINTLIIDTFATGISFKGKEKVSQSSRLFLNDLAVINVYDYTAEFYSRSSIDFSYVYNSHESHQQALNYFVQEKIAPLRAQWVDPDDDLDRLMEELSIGRVIEEEVPGNRMLDMDFEDFG